MFSTFYPPPAPHTPNTALKKKVVDRTYDLLLRCRTERRKQVQLFESKVFEAVGQVQILGDAWLPYHIRTVKASSRLGH